MKFCAETEKFFVTCTRRHIVQHLDLHYKYQCENLALAIGLRSKLRYKPLPYKKFSYRIFF